MADNVIDFADLLEPVSVDRRRHSVEVGRKAASRSDLVAPWVRADLVVAATLHDVGYGHPVSGFHPLDGARFLAAQGFSMVVCDLVLGHSASRLEAEERGLDLGVYDEFSCGRDVAAAAAVLWWADMTTGPQGQTVRVEDRLDEICARYGPDDLVTRFITRARPLMLAAGQSPLGALAVSM